ncbi:MAG: SxtJ family membrane protein [Candidatus Omnitrophica bacterium]|nr:SxtJ family membrane protein [Candidatus Omnitrophota bacterium]
MENSIKKDLRKFGMAAGLFLSVMAVLYHPKAIYLAVPGLFFLLAVFCPGILRPFYIVWMKLAIAVAWVITRLLLAIVFYLVITPIGLLSRLFIPDPLERRIDRNRKSYWKSREEQYPSPSDYKRQF